AGHPHTPGHTDRHDSSDVQQRAPIGQAPPGPGERTSAGPVLPPADTSGHAGTGDAPSTSDTVQQRTQSGGTETSSRAPSGGELLGRATPADRPEATTRPTHAAVLHTHPTHTRRP